MTQVIAAFFAYFAILLVIGVVSHRRQTSNAEFIVGNRSLNFWLTALSAHASDMSAWLFMGLPMAVFLHGLSGSWIAIGLFIGMFSTWQFVAGKLRTATENYNSYTLSTYFEKRFSDTSGTIRLLTAVMFLFFLSHYLSAALIAMGLLLESVFGIDYYWGLSFATCVVVAYTFGGGFVTIAWTDLFQSLFLLFAIILVPILAFNSLDNGFETMRAVALSKDGYLNLFGDMSTKSIVSSVSLALAWGLGYFGMPHIITKFMGIRDVTEMRKSKYVGMTWQFLALSASISVGLVGGAFFLGNLEKPELVFIEMVKVLFHPFAAGFVLCGVLAANLSTMDSMLLVCASVIGEDLYKRFAGNRSTPLKAVRASRVGVILVAFTALFIAFNKSETILDTVLYAWAGLGSSFGPLVLMSLYFKKANKYGAIAGVFVGGTIACVWPQISSFFTDYDVPAMIPGFFLGLLSIYFVSLATHKKAQIR
ncbi:MAG: High-affinity proline transporter PutP [Chlamydiae bacterium]|nr:High-affinity proline transporter PutP [Chlamydiota bacterium]